VSKDKVDRFLQHGRTPFRSIAPWLVYAFLITSKYGVIREELTGIRKPIYRSPMGSDYEHLLPLSPATLHVLLALASEDLHGEHAYEVPDVGVR
jgi:hypothetical protein